MDNASQIYIGDNWTEYHRPGYTSTIDLTAMGCSFSYGDKMAWTFAWDVNDADKAWLRFPNEAGGGNDGSGAFYAASDAGYSAYAILKFFGRKTGGNGVKGR